MRAALGAALLLAAAAVAGAAQGCPEGSVSVGEGRCAKDMSRGPFLEMRGPRKRGGPPPCPQGTHTVESPLGYRCVMGSGDGAPAAAASVPPAAPEPPLEKVLAADGPPGAETPVPPGPPKEFAPFRAKGLRLSLPRGWHVTDAWNDEVPTVYVELDARRRGKPVTMLISRLSPAQDGYEPLDGAIAKEKEYQGAREGAPRSVGGLPARQTLVAGESRSAWADAGSGVYYLLSYSAPKDSFAVYEPAFERLLQSARFGR